jgi:hypothetical protein
VGAKKGERNVETSAALKAKALGGCGVEFPEAFVMVTTKLRTMARLSDNFITSLERVCRQQRVFTRFCKVFSGPTPEESVVEASGLAELFVCLGRDSLSEFPPLESGHSDWQWHPFLAGGELALGEVNVSSVLHYLAKAARANPALSIKITMSSLRGRRPRRRRWRGAA